MNAFKKNRTRKSGIVLASTFPKMAPLAIAARAKQPFP